MYSIYLITNVVNGKVYVGQTMTSVKLRWQCHLYCARSGQDRYLYNAIRKHGEENFVVDILCSGLTKSQADEFERLYIFLLQSYDRMFGYNGTLGGDGCIHTKETREKISRSLVGLPKPSPSLEHRLKVSNALKGHKVSEETRTKLRKSQKLRRDRERTLYGGMLSSGRMPDCLSESRSSILLIPAITP